MIDTVLKIMWSSGTVTASARNGEENHSTILPTLYHSDTSVSGDLIGVECYTHIMCNMVLKMPSIILMYVLLCSHLVQSPFKFWFSAGHYRHLILV